MKEDDHQDLNDQEKIYLELISKRKEQREEIQKRITEAGRLHNIQFFASAYGVSVEAVKIYLEKTHEYPVLYYVGDTEQKIVHKLNMIERLLKIKKLRNV